MERGPEGIDVAGGRGLTSILLRRRVALGADHGALLARLEVPGDAEVDEPDKVVLIHHHIGGLHVPENDWLGLVVVQVVEDVAKLNSPVDDLLLG